MNVLKLSSLTRCVNSLLAINFHTHNWSIYIVYITVNAGTWLSTQGIGLMVLVNTEVHDGYGIITLCL